MNEKIESIQKSIDIFREMIEKNSFGIFLDYYELTPSGSYKKEYDDSFKEIREVILNKEHDEEYLRKDSFIIYLKMEKEIDKLDWKSLLEIFKENKKNRENYLKFLRDLERAAKSDVKKYSATFTMKDLNRFLSDVIGEINDDDSGVPVVPLIPEKQRNTIIENKEENGEGEKNEFSESSEQSGKKCLKSYNFKKKWLHYWNK